MVYVIPDSGVVDGKVETKRTAESGGEVKK